MNLSLEKKGNFLKTFCANFSCCPKKLSCPKFGGAAALPALPAHTPMLLTSNFTCSLNICTVISTPREVVFVFFAKHAFGTPPPKKKKTTNKNKTKNTYQL